MCRAVGLQLLCLLSFATNVVVPLLRAADKPPAAVADARRQAELEHWISELNAPEFARRERATSWLIDAGPSAANALVAAAKEASPEAGVRIATILRSWYTSGEDALIDAAEVALEQLTESKNRHLSGRAAGTLRQYAATIGQPRALAQIEKLGGKRVETAATARFRGAFGNEPERLVLMLGADWKGGADAIKYLRRIPSLSGLFLVKDPSTGQIKTPGITQQHIDELVKTHPWVQVVFRGKAFLGVTANAHLLGVSLDQVAENSPAAKAKLMVEDVLTKFDGKPIQKFDDLVDCIAAKDPGAVVKVEVLRGNLFELEELVRQGRDEDADTIKKLREKLTLTLEVTLGGW